MKSDKKPKCEIKTHIGCNGTMILRYKGRKKTDPEFNCCMGCAAILRRMGVKFKEVKEMAK